MCTDIIRNCCLLASLTVVNSDIFQIEKVLKSRKRGGVVEHFVKWKGYDNRHNSWITSKDITQVFRGHNE